MQHTYDGQKNYIWTDNPISDIISSTVSYFNYRSGLVRVDELKESFSTFYKPDDRSPWLTALFFVESTRNSVTHA